MRWAWSLLLITASASAAERALSFSQPAEDLEAVEVEVVAGDVTVTGSENQHIEAQVVATGKRWQLEKLEVQARRRGRTLQLSLSGRPPGGRAVEEDWQLRVPKGCRLKVTAGVGDVSVRGMEAELTLRVGVGDVTVAGFGSALKAEAGVGDVDIRGHWPQVGSLRLVTGVGSISVRTPEGRARGHGFVSESYQGQGPGQAQVVVTTGVGDVTVRLQED